MNAFLVRLLIAVGIIVLVEYVLKVIKLRESAARIIFAVTVIVCALFAVFGEPLVHWLSK